MRVTVKDLGHGPYLLVQVDSGHTFCTGRSLPFGTWLGTVNGHGEIDLWTPATSGVPRWYRAEAMAVLESVRATHVRDGRIVTSKGERIDVAIGAPAIAAD